MSRLLDWLKNNRKKVAAITVILLPYIQRKRKQKRKYAEVEQNKPHAEMDVKD